MATAVIYARYSSEKQREESIEGQIRKCTEYAARNGITIIESYIDRAISGKTDERPAFQQLIADSAKKKFDTVLVYALNRFSRNIEHYYRYKNVLNAHSVTLLSATEVIPDGPSGIIMEAMLVGYNEFYSAELAQKIRRGQDENAQKLKFNGGSLPLGYITDDDQHYIIDSAEAVIVVEIFTRYADGETLTEIINSLNSRGLRTKRGNEFNKNSLHTILKNRRYLGVYEYRDVVIEGAFEPIIPQELFDKVQSRLAINKVASAHTKADEPFILTTKLFCGDCGAAMIGESGTGRNGKHYYYKCSNNKRKKICKRKAVRKHLIENIVISNITELLFSDKRLQEIADMVMEIQEKTNTIIPMLQRELKTVTKSIDNILDAIQQMGLSESLQQRYEALEKRKAELEISIKTEQLREKKLSRDEVLCWLEHFRGIDTSDIKQREMLVNIFVNAVFVFDDRIVIVYNFKDDTRTTELTEVTCRLGSGSDIACSSPPKHRIIMPIMRCFSFFGRDSG